MASGRPLLASPDGDSALAKVVKAAGCGLCVEPENAGDLAEAILQLYRDPSLREQMGKRGREYAEAHHSKHAAVTRYDELLRRVAGGGEKG